MHAPVLDIIRHWGNPVSTIGRPGAGPGISLSFLLVAIVCSFAALCYAELASMIPIAGSAYTYAYATLGEIIAWIIGWDLILEYAVSNMAVAVGFSAYFNDILDAVFGVHLPAVLSAPMIMGGEFTGSYFNLPAFLIIMVLTYVLVRGVRESAGANNVMVIVKIAGDRDLHRRGVGIGARPRTGGRSCRTVSAACLPAPPSCSSPTSDSTLSRRLPRNASGRSAICRSASS